MLSLVLDFFIPNASSLRLFGRSRTNPDRFASSSGRHVLTIPKSEIHRHPHVSIPKHTVFGDVCRQRSGQTEFVAQLFQRFVDRFQHLPDAIRLLFLRLVNPLVEYRKDIIVSALRFFILIHDCLRFVVDPAIHRFAGFVSCVHQSSVLNIGIPQTRDIAEIDSRHQVGEEKYITSEKPLSRFAVREVERLQTTDNARQSG